MTIVETKQFRRALGAYATGVTIITFAGRSGKNYGLTANSFSSVSLDPPLVLWSLDKKSSGLREFLEAEGFAVHILSEGQEQLSQIFSRSQTDKFSGVPFRRGFDGAPLLDDYVTRLECAIAQKHEAGDHWVVIGKVLQMDSNDLAPLVYLRGQFVSIAGDRP